MCQTTYVIIAHRVYFRDISASLPARSVLSFSTLLFIFLQATKYEDLELISPHISLDPRLEDPPVHVAVLMDLTPTINTHFIVNSLQSIIQAIDTSIHQGRIPSPPPHLFCSVMKLRNLIPQSTAEVYQARLGRRLFFVKNTWNLIIVGTHPLALFVATKHKALGSMLRGIICIEYFV